MIFWVLKRRHGREELLSPAGAPRSLEHDLADLLRIEVDVPLRAFHLEVKLSVGRETVALVGPSGAGKTTVLRSVAGLVRPQRGRIRIGEEVLFDAERGVDLPPERRRVGLVFQEYALFPHMTVEQNVAYAGRGRQRELLERLRISHLAKARPAQLSGGERQRVALARALARDPAVLLLDEPLSALDAHTKADVRAELEELLHELALPTIFVTHDFEDAAALADRVGILVEGRILQLGPPDELLAAPSHPFVASFTGGNLVYGEARRDVGGLTVVELADGTVVYSTDTRTGAVGVVVYPWEITLSRTPPSDSAMNHVTAEVRSVVELGNRVRVRIGPFVAEVTATSSERLAVARGERMTASFKATATRLVPVAERGSLSAWQDTHA